MWLHAAASSEALKYSHGLRPVDCMSAPSIREPQGVWRGRWVDKPDGAKIVMNVLSRYDAASKIETGLFRYELWEKNAISRTEVEEFQVRHYAAAEIELLLKQHGLKVVGKWQAEPYARIAPGDGAAVIMYECVKG